MIHRLCPAAPSRDRPLRTRFNWPPAGTDPSGQGSTGPQPGPTPQDKVQLANVYLVKYVYLMIYVYLVIYVYMVIYVYICTW